MVPNGVPSPATNRNRLKLLAIVVSVVAVVAVATAVLLYVDLSHISSCNGGLGPSNCPANIEFGIREWQNGTFVAGVFTYSFILFPIGATVVNPSDLSVIFLTHAGAEVSPSDLGLYSFQGATLAIYHSGVAGSWTTTQETAADLPATLQFTSPTSLAGDSVDISDPSASFSIGAGIL